MANRQNLSTETQKPSCYRPVQAVWFNKMCKIHQRTPTYNNIKVIGENPQGLNNKRAATS
jgi:hypothetical protein